VPLNNAFNINPMGTSVQVTATAGPLTQTVNIEVKPLLTGLDWVAGQYAFERNPAQSPPKATERTVSWA
jgi:hypothetical protein